MTRRFILFKTEARNLYSRQCVFSRERLFYYTFMRNKVMHVGPFRKTFEESRRDLFIKKCVLS